MDLDDLLDGIGPSGELGPRGQRVARLVVGLALFAGCAVGAWHVGTETEGGIAFRAAGVAFFAAVGLFGLVGIAFGRAVKALGCAVGLSFGLLFAARIVFGA